MIKLKDRDQGVLWNAASLVILGVSGVLINSLILFLRGEAALGIFNQAYAVYIVFSQIGVAGVQFSVLNRLSINTGDRETSSRITGSALLLVFGFSSLIALLGWTLASAIGNFLDSPDVAVSIRILMPGLVLFCLNKVLINVVNAYEEMKSYAVFRSLRFLLIPVFIIAVIIGKFEDPLLLISLTITELILFLFLVRYVFARLVRIRFSFDALGNYLDHLKFSLKGFFSGVLVELNTRLDVLILGYFVDDYSVGLYSFVAVLAEGYSQFSYALRWNIDPELGRLLHAEDRSGIEELAAGVRKKYYYLILIGGALICAAYPFAYRLLNGEYSWLSTAMFFVMMVGVLLGAWYRPFSGIILQGGKPGFYTIYILALLLGDGLLNILLIPSFGILGAAVVTMITYILEGLYLRIASRRLFEVRL
jgi:O-antigen/teichoic acid export membrane protein